MLSFEMEAWFDIYFKNIHALYTNLTLEVIHVVFSTLIHYFIQH